MLYSFLTRLCLKRGLTLSGRGKNTGETTRPPKGQTPFQTEPSRRALAIACLVLVASGNSAAQVPDESQLPVVAPPTTIPDESQLPAKTGPATNELPNEAAIPGLLPGADGAVAGDTERESSLSPGTLRPWLRLRFDGHTGTIRSLAMSSDGQYLVSGGEDKDLHIWSRQTIDGTLQNWFHRRTVRWPIERGPRGRIYATAIQGNMVAMAGHGATGGLGEIWIIDLTTGNLVRSLVDANLGHRQVIASLAWQPPKVKAAGDQDSTIEDLKNLSLASADVEGHVILWTPDAATGIWSPRTIIASDPETYGAAVASVLASRRRFVPIAFLGYDQLLMPRYVGPAAEDATAANWQILRFNLSSRSSDVLAIDHTEMMSSMTTSDDGLRIASGDVNGRIWHASIRNDTRQLQSKAFSALNSRALSVDFADDGKHLLVGTSPVADVEKPETEMLKWFDTSDLTVGPVEQSAIAVPSYTFSSIYDDRTREAITVSGNHIETHSVANNQINAVASQMLKPPVGPIRRVAFVNQSDTYKIGIGTEVGGGQTVPISSVFDLSAVRLEPSVDAANGGIDPASLIDPIAAKAQWDLVRGNVDEGVRNADFLFEGPTKRWQLPLRGELHGLATSTAWFDELVNPNEPLAKRRKAVVVGTDGRNNVYVYETGDAAEAKLLRQFRGHTGPVLSVGVSPDLRYVVSGSDDATVCIWKLDDVFTADEITNRWGASFEVRGDRLFALTVRRDGPLYFRGVREGDQLVSMNWIDEREPKAAADPAAMLAGLVQSRFDSLVVFQFARLGRPREAFQSYPSWQPVATLFVDKTREWALWTPAGFYDASFGGNELFGWQINRGISALPDYFRAAQFRQRLENPAAMRKLMSVGDLTTAMEDGISGIAPPPGEGAIVNQVLSKPVIRLLSPQSEQVVTTGEVDVEAEIMVPRGSVLEPPKAFAGGVPAVGRKLIRHEEVGDQERYLYRWTARLPRDSRVSLDVIAATDSGAIDRLSIELDNQSKPPARQPRMHFLALGVSQYADPQIQKLDFAARGAGVMANLFRDLTPGLYRTTTSELTDQDAIRPLWRDYAAQAAQELAKDIMPDDLVVMYLCGHGIRDRRTNQWYFVTADARYNDLMNDRYDDLLSFDDLAMLGELPCRKLAIIDSCHSGAVQPVMRSDDLKAAMRLLQGDVVLTMTASEGEEEAAEQKDRQLGRFTSHLVDALQGSGDANNDRIVTLREAVDHVMRASAEESRTSGFVQHPTAGPADLLKTLNLPLTRR